MVSRSCDYPDRVNTVRIITVALCKTEVSLSPFSLLLPAGAALRFLDLHASRGYPPF
jgi:hypothetical protein